MKLRFANNTKVEVPSAKDATLYIRKHHPDLLAEWCEHLDKFNNTFSKIDKHIKHENQRGSFKRS